jgi:hypothetical protein
MALKTSQPDAVTRFGLEDVFVGGDAEKLAWVNGWRKLPHLTRDVEALFDYPQQFAEEVFERIENALCRRAADDETNAGVRTGRLFIVPEDASQDDAKPPLIPDLAVQYIGSSDMQLVKEHKADHHDEAQLRSDRQEGRCILSYQTPGGWVAITKDILTDVLGVGRDVKLVGLPAAAVGVLTLMCPTLVISADQTHDPSATVR